MTTELDLLNKPRNYSFLHKKEDALDAVEEGDAVFVIPAQPGSCYWAIIKVGYMHHDRPLRLEQYIDLVAELLEERNQTKWEEFKNKKNIKTVRGGDVVEKPANSWRKRVETNIKTLTRDGGKNPYGNRLRERGHILRWEPDYFPDDGAFVLRTTTKEPLEIKRGRNRKGRKV